MTFMAETGPLPLGWLYLSEVGNYKAVGVGSGSSWFGLVIAGIATKPLFESEKYGDYSFMIFGCINIVSTIIIYFTFKETKGLSEA
jgi:hypothetical protein